MSIVVIKGVEYHTEDRVKRCPICNSWMYDKPSLREYLDLTTGQLSEFYGGLWGVSYCPECHFVDIWYK